MLVKSLLHFLSDLYVLRHLVRVVLEFEIGEEGLGREDLVAAHDNLPFLVQVGDLVGRAYLRVGHAADDEHDEARARASLLLVSISVPSRSSTKNKRKYKLKYLKKNTRLA